jgi:hypothetical protein
MMQQKPYVRILADDRATTLSIGTVSAMASSRLDQLSSDQALLIAARIKADRFEDADTILVAGSVATGRASPTSDLDLLVIYDRIDNARRQSFQYDGLMVDAFCHDLETINYFCWEIDRPSGVPTLPLMLEQGLELPPCSPLTAVARATGEMVLAAGPLHLSEQEISQRRARIASLIDDLASARSDAERLASGVLLYGLLADSELRMANVWSGNGKGLYIAFERHDEALARKHHQSFDALFSGGDHKPVIEMAGAFLERTGGRIVRRSEVAPQEWRKPLDI